LYLELELLEDVHWDEMNETGPSKDLRMAFCNFSDESCNISGMNVVVKE
jgi:hypothetical protein